MQDKLSRGAKHLHPLKVGDHVLIQDQHGNNPKQWNKTGVVTEVGPYDSYLVSVDGSRQVTKRNRRFLRLIKPDKPYALSSEAFQTPPRLRPGQSSSPPDTLPTTPPVILRPPRAPEPELPVVAQPASPLPVHGPVLPPPTQPPVPPILLQKSGDDWRIANQHNIHMFNPHPSSVSYHQSHWPLYQQLPAYVPPPPPQHYQHVNSFMQTSPWLPHLPSSSQQNPVGDINRIPIFHIGSPHY